MRKELIINEGEYFGVGISFISVPSSSEVIIWQYSGKGEAVGVGLTSHIIL